MQGPEVGVGGFGLLCVLPMAVLAILAFVLWIWMLVDCLMNEPSTGNDKIIWAVVIIFLHWIGALLYYFIRRPQRIREHGK